MTDKPELPLGRKEYAEGVWVQFKTKGYPFKLRREWESLTDDAAVLGIVLRYVESWSLKDVNGNEIVLGPDPAVLDGAEDALIVWLIGSFSRFWRVELPTVPKNA